MAEPTPNRASSQIKVLGTLFILFCLRELRTACPSSFLTAKRKANLKNRACFLVSAFILSMFFYATAHAQTLRLAEFQNPSSAQIVLGRLEYSNNKGVCDDYFTDDDAMVACRELGHEPREAKALTRLDGPSGEFWLDNLLCRGHEASLGVCDKAGSVGNGGGGYGDHNCRDVDTEGFEVHEHAGVVCYSEVTAPEAPTLSAERDSEREDAIKLSWAAPKIKITGHNIYIESIVDRYELQVSEDGSTGWTNVATNIISTRRNFNHGGLSPGTWYYRIRAVNGMENDNTKNGPYSNVADATLGGDGRPVFSQGTSTTRSVAEEAAKNPPYVVRNVGDPVTATDSDSYSLGGTDAGKFDIDSSTGQIKTRTDVLLDYETKNSYSVTVTATGSGGTSSITVTISVTNVDEPGEVTFSYPSPFQVDGVLTATLSDPDGPSGVTWMWHRSTDKSTWRLIDGATSAGYTLTVDDEANYLRATATYTDGVFGSETVEAISDKVPNLNWPPEFSDDTATFSLPEEVNETPPYDVRNVGMVTATDREMDTLFYDLGGTDAASFGIITSTGQIKTKTDVLLDYETKDSYSVEVTARDRPLGAADLQSDTITVTISLTNQDDPGKVFLSMEPEVGTPLTATLTDPDGQASGIMWEWEKSTSRTNGWIPVSGTPVDNTYTPVDDVGNSDVGYYLRATATYRDALFGSGKTATGVSDTPVSAAPVSNSPPEFTENDSTTRSVREDAPLGSNVGDPVRATDSDLNHQGRLTYNLDGDGTDKDSFSIDSLGQITTDVLLDYETDPSYSVEVTARDPGGASDMITVTINVTAVVDESGSLPTPQSPYVPQSPSTKSPSQVTKSTSTTVPHAPSGLMATRGDAEVTLNWRAPNDGGSAIEYYEYKVDGGAWTSTGGKSTSYTVTGLTNGETYRFRVRAVNSIGPGTKSEPVSATPATVPGAPRNLTTTPGNQRVTLIWERPTDNGGLPITSYQYSQKEEDGSFGSWVSMDDSGPRGANETSYTVTGLKNGTVYSFKVRAVNAVGPGDSSAEATVEPSTSAFRRARRASLNILPTFGRTMLRNSVDALTWRLDSVLSGSFERTGMFRLMDQHAGLHEVLGNDIWDDPDQWEELSLEELLYGSSFIMEAGGMLRKPKEHPKEDPKGYVGEDPREYIREYPEEDSTDEDIWIDKDEKPVVVERKGDIGFWGKADYNNLSISGDELFTWDGRIVSGYMGVDRWLNEKVLTGLSVSLTKGDFGYTDRTEGGEARGDYYVKMLSVSPYVSWFLSDDVYLWSALGYGRGEIDIDDEEVQSVATSDLSYKSLAVGGSGRVFDVGDTTFSLKSEAFKVWMDVEGDDYLIDELSVDVHQLRLSMEGSYEYRFASGTWFSPLVEVALRHDGGDGETGTGVELGGGFLYEDPNLGLSVSGRGRWLVAHSSQEFSQWGVGGTVIFDTGADKRGALFSVSPEWGDTSSGVDGLWERGVEGLSSQDGVDAEMHLDAEFGYGLSALGGDGLLTPYSGLRLGGDGRRQYRLGSRLDLGRSASLSLETDRRQSDTTKPEHGIMLRGKLNF